MPHLNSTDGSYTVYNYTYMTVLHSMSAYYICTVPVIDIDCFPGKGRLECGGLCLVVSLQHGLCQAVLGHLPGRLSQYNSIT